MVMGMRVGARIYLFLSRVWTLTREILSVRLSVYLSRSFIVSKRLKNIVTITSPSHASPIILVL